MPSVKLEHSRYLYHYTSAEVLIKHIAPSMQLRMSPVSLVNDPRELKAWLPSLGFRGGALPMGMEFGDFLLAFNRVMKDHTKVLCFTRDATNMTPDSPPDLYGWGYAHSRMWDRYAEQHKGVCLVFDIDTLGDEIALSIGPRGSLLSMGVSYFNYPPNEGGAFHMDTSTINSLGLTDALISHRDQFHGELYFYKAKDWEAENEWRWLLFSNGEDQWEYVSVRRSLAGVIFGCDALKEDVRDVKWTLRNHTAQLFMGQMLYRNGHPILTTYP